MINKFEMLKNRQKCYKCGLHKTCKNPFIISTLSKIPRSIDFFFLGEAPGREEDETGVPFIGQAGQSLRPVLNEIGFGEYYLSNSLKCRPPRNQTPVMKQLNYCWDFLYHELLLLAPKNIICLGATAAKALGFKGSLKRLKQDVHTEIPLTGKKCNISITYHPAFILREPSKFQEFVNDLANAKSLFEGRKDKIPYYLNSIKYNSVLKFDRAAKVISCDLETASLDDVFRYPDKTPEILAFACATDKIANCYSWVHGKSVWLGNNLKDKLQIWHNIKFDYKFLKSQNINLSDYECIDTMIMSALINELEPSHSLKKLAFKVGMGGYERSLEVPIDQLKDNKIEKWYEYACGDVEATYKLFHYFKPQMEEMGLMELAKELTRYQYVLAEMELNGVMIDTNLLKQYKTDIAKEIKQMQNKMFCMSYIKNPKEFNFNSNQQVIPLITDLFKYRLTQRTDKGNLKLDEQVLLTVIDSNNKKASEFCTHLLKYKKLKKLESTYLENIENYLISETQRIHPSFNILGAATGRLSSSAPNLQNQPKGGNSIPLIAEIYNKYSIRNLFIAPEGYKLIAVDYSQLELRVMAVMANDKTMINCFLNNEDLHQKTADGLGVSRSVAKVVNFGGICYGGGHFILYSAVKNSGGSIASLDEAEHRYNQLVTKTYPGVGKYQVKIIKDLIEKGYVTNYYGRRRHFPEYRTAGEKLRRHIENAAINAPVQSTASEIVMKATNKVYEFLKSKKFKPVPKIIGNVHDEVLFEVKDEIVKPFCIKIKEIMESVEFPIPLLVEIKVGDNWNNLKVFEGE